MTAGIPDEPVPVEPDLLIEVHSVGENRWMKEGERMLLWCRGGPSLGRATNYPPPVEIEVEGGVYVLIDDGPPEEWHYAYVSGNGSSP